MSIAVSSRVWQHGPRVRNQRFVMLAIADNANDEGYAYPLVRTIATKCVMTPRNVIRIISNLVDDEWLTVQPSPKNYKANAYQLNLRKLSGEKLSCDNSNDSQVTKSAVSGEKTSIPILSNSHEPSREPPAGEIQLSASEDNPRDVVRRLFAHYVEKTERIPRLYELTNKRMATGLDRLKDCQCKCGGDIGKAEELMRIPIDNLVKSEFHMGKNDRGQRYIDWIDHLFKNTEKLEWWLDR